MATAHNKRKQCGPAGPDVASLRRLTNTLGAMMSDAGARFRAVCVSIAAAFGLYGCDVTVTAGKHHYEGGGVKFEIPLERSDATHGTYGISYRGPRFVAETDGKALWIDGQVYGSLNAGDVVDFYEYPVIKVNGVVREPPGT